MCLSLGKPKRSREEIPWVTLIWLRLDKLLSKKKEEGDQIQLEQEGTLICTPPCAAPCKGSGVATITPLKTHLLSIS